MPGNEQRGKQSSEIQRLNRSDHPGLEPVTPEAVIMGEVWMCAHKWVNCVSWNGLKLHSGAATYREWSNGRVRWQAE